MKDYCIPGETIISTMSFLRSHRSPEVYYYVTLKAQIIQYYIIEFIHNIQSNIQDLSLIIFDIDLRSYLNILQIIFGSFLQNL